MIIEILNSCEEIGHRAKTIFVEYLSQNRSLLFCAATGHSPTKMYGLLAEECMIHPELFSLLRVIKLDEWGSIQMTHPGSCEYYLQQHVIGPLAITNERYFSFHSNPENLEFETNRIQQILKDQGPIDICVLGIGINGHIALNEPATFLKPHCHVATLTDSSLQHPMISGERQKPQYGLTLGMADILQSKKIILLINGIQKREITQNLLSARITTDLPASFLWLHPDVTCLIEKKVVN